MASQIDTVDIESLRLDDEDIKTFQRLDGRPPFVPTAEERALVEQMTSVGIPQESQCLLIRGIDSKTMRKHFRHELDTAKIKANLAIGGMLFAKAMGGDTTAMIFWAKTQMGWKETTTTELVGKDGAPIVLWGGQK